MPNTNRPTPDDIEARRGEEPIPSASEDEVLEDTARLAREGRKQLESDPKEPKPGPS